MCLVLSIIIKVPSIDCACELTTCEKDFVLNVLIKDVTHRINDRELSFLVIFDIFIPFLQDISFRYFDLVHF